MVYGETIWQSIESNAACRGEAKAYIHQGDVHTWSDVKRDVEAAACVLMGEGVRRKSRVGLWGLNSYEWVVCYFACAEIGACAVLANYSYRFDEMAYFVDYGEVEYLLVGEVKDGIDARGIAQELQDAQGRELVCFEMAKVAHSAAPSKEPLDLLESARLQVKPSDAACVIFTSGTTKRPKGVVLSQENVTRMSISLAERLELSSDDVQLIALGMFHGSGLNACVMPALQAGTCSVIMGCFSSLKALDAIQRYRCTVFNSIPSLVLMMTRHDSFADYDLSSLRCGIFSGGAVADAQFARIAECLGNMRVIMAYGQTEATSISTTTYLADAPNLRNGMCGTPLDEVQLRIADPETDRVVDAGCQGEIQIGGFSRMDGYLGLPEQNHDAFASDGWLKTGDYGRIDESGCLWFAGRIDDMIVRAGENVSPAEIESVIAGYSPAIGAVKVVGVESALLSQEIAAFFTASEDIDITEIRAYLERTMAKYKVPSFIKQLDEMPQTSSGKLDSKEIKRLAKAMASEREGCR